MLSEAGKCPKTEATVLRSELGWTPRPTEHSICPTSLPHPLQYPWVMSLLFMVMGKAATPKGQTSHLQTFTITPRN